MGNITKMLEAQSNLQKIMPPLDTHPRQLHTNEEKIDFIKEMKLALESELQELLDEVGWKQWATSKHINRDAAVGELVDAWHFFMNFMLVLGVEEEELVEKYYAKRDKNIQRQLEGYDGVSTKCPLCKRAYDDDHVYCYPAREVPMNTGMIQTTTIRKAYCDVIKEHYETLPS